MQADEPVSYTHLVLQEIHIGSPYPRLYQVQVPGRDGMVDLSRVLTGDIIYDNRTLQFKFAMEDGDFSRMFRKASIFLADVQGKTLDIMLDEDPDYFYRGICTAEIEKVNCMVSTCLLYTSRCV